jgi:choline dehydrogenase
MDSEPRTTIVVGSGSSGGVIAARLTEHADEHVILLEAGPDFPILQDLPATLADAYNPDLTGHDWGFSAFMVEPPEARKPAPYPRGKVVGGSSAVNGTLAQRGETRDFDEWQTVVGPEWSWEQVLPFFKALERDLEYGDEHDYHGDDGPVPIIRIPRERWSRVADAFVQACNDRGFDFAPDLNQPEATGISPVPRNQDGEYRASTLVTYLRASRQRENLEIVSGALATRVLFDGERAVGVEAIVGGETREFRADRVVISAGAIGSPHLLMHSGIGPRALLEETGIECRLDRPGVGANLRDHPFVPVMATLADNEEKSRGFSVKLRYASGPGRRNDIQITPAVFDARSTIWARGVDEEAVVVWSVLVGKPASIGWLKPAADPAQPPELHLNFLAAEEDAARLRAGVRLAYEIATSEPVSDHLSEVRIPDAETLDDDAKLDDWLTASVSSGYHPVGTCRMGLAEDPGAVVGPRLNVHGVEGLYVADASIMPNITCGQTNMACYMIGERAGAWLRNGSGA